MRIADGPIGDGKAGWKARPWGPHMGAAHHVSSSKRTGQHLVSHKVHPRFTGLRGGHLCLLIVLIQRKINSSHLYDRRWLCILQRGPPPPRPTSTPHPRTEVRLSVFQSSWDMGSLSLLLTTLQRWSQVLEKDSSGQYS